MGKKKKKKKESERDHRLSCKRWEFSVQEYETANTSSKLGEYLSPGTLQYNWSTTGFESIIDTGSKKQNHLVHNAEFNIKAEIGFFFAGLRS